MKQASPFHPELRRAARLIPRLSFGPRLTRAIKVLQRWKGVSPPPQVEGVMIRDELIAGPSGAPLRVRVYFPQHAANARPAMLWIHGGGFIIGSPEQDEAHSIELCRSLGMVVVAVDYRLAPEHPYPAPMDDCYCALSWLHANATQLNVDTHRVVVGGNSAGAGLAAGLALLAMDRKQLPVAFQLLIYPMLDDRTTLRTDVDESRLCLWTHKSNQYGWTSYLGSEPGRAEVPVYAAPARRSDLRGLAPAWIGVGTCDLFHDEDLAYAQRLTDAGVPCMLKIVDGAFHGFEIAGLDKPIVRDFRKSYFDALREALG